MSRSRPRGFDQHKTLEPRLDFVLRTLQKENHGSMLSLIRVMPLTYSGT
jgi:hypothetical protein